MECCRLDAMPISLPLAGYHPLEVGCAPGTTGDRSRADGPSILLFQHSPEEHCEAFPVNGENLHLRLSKVEKLFSGRSDDHTRNRLTKSGYPQTPLGRSVHNDRRRLVSGKSSILWLSLADRHEERVVLTAWEDYRIEIGRLTSVLVASANFAKSFYGIRSYCHNGVAGSDTAQRIHNASIVAQPVLPELIKSRFHIGIPDFQ